MAQAQQAPSGGVTPHLSVEGGDAALDFYKRAFAAEELSKMYGQDGKRLMHCHLRINGGSLMLNDIFAEFGMTRTPSPNYVMHLQVDDADAWWNRAVGAGCEVAMPLGDQFWGDRYGQLTDPFGVRWSIGAAIKA